MDFVSNMLKNPQYGLISKNKRRATDAPVTQWSPCHPGRHWQVNEFALE